jgi:uncharacterized protein (DUF1778 family)
MNKKMGRPKLASGEARGEFISTRLTADEYQEIESAVKNSGRSKTEWVRNALLATARSCVTKSA